MEDKSGHDQNPDDANESENRENIGKSEENDDTDRHEVKKDERKEVTDSDEGRAEEEGSITDESGGKEAKDLGNNVGSHVSDDTAQTPVLDGVSPNPPPRQRRKSKTNSQKGDGGKEVEEKAHGGEESECQDQRNTTEEEKRKRSADPSLENEDEDMKAQTEETKHTTKHNETPVKNARKRGKKTEIPDVDKETKPSAGKDVEKDEVKKDMKDPAVCLKQELTLLNCVGIIVGNIIGTGIFVAPRAVVHYTGSVGMSLIVWALSGFMAIVGAFCYVELGTMIPQSGGNYTYLFEAYGSLPAFICLWVTVVIGIPGSRAIAALTFANYVLQPFFPNEQAPPDSALRIVGILLIVTLAFINSRRVRWATRVQDFMALTKVFALIVIIVVGLFHLARGTTDNFDNPMEGTSTNPALIVTAFYHTLYAYEGWDSLNSIMEELKDPLRNTPRAVAFSVTSVIVIYMLTNVAYFAVLPKELILASPAVAVTFGNIVLGVMAWTIPIFVACSISGGLNGSTFATSRLLFVSARRGHLPRVLSFVHVENNTPVTSLVFLTVMSMCMFVTSDVRVLINYLAFAFNLVNLACISTFFWFRVKHPDLPRPIKVWIGFPIIYTILSVFVCVMPVVKQPLEVVAALLVLLTGLPVFYFLVHRKEKPKRLVTAMEKVTYVCQLLFMAVPEERSD